MQKPNEASSEQVRRTPWNKGKVIGAKPPLRTKHVWSIRTKLQVEGRKRDLAMFNLAIDSKLRGCDVVSLKVQDVAPQGLAVDRASVRQKKTGHPVRFELTEQTREAIDDYIRAEGKRPGEYLFASHRNPGRCMSTRQYARLLSGWLVDVGLDPHFFWNAFVTPDQGDAHLSSHRQSAGRPIAPGTHQDREHDTLPRY